jgi:predicted transcriptional regulator
MISSRRAGDPLAKEAVMSATGARQSVIHGDCRRATAAVRRAGSLAPGADGQLALVGLRADPRQAVQQDAIWCLVCGGVFRQLTNTHLRSHGLTADEYKRRFGYNRGRPLMCRALRGLYADRAVKNGLAARIRQRPILARPELRRRGGARRIALEEMLTRREARRSLPHTPPPR